MSGPFRVEGAGGKVVFSLATDHTRVLENHLVVIVQEILSNRISTCL